VQRRGDEDGFTLIELLVVMIIIAILAAISVPAVTSQRAKAHDTATRSDASRLGKAVHGWYLSETVPPAVQIMGGRYDLSADDLGPVSRGVVVEGAQPAGVDTTGWTSLAWCLDLTNPSGSVRTFKYSAQQGLASGPCASPVSP
jgi:prepilin-type N-terminal cleavage/methylation domain-containing protein